MDRSFVKQVCSLGMICNIIPSYKLWHKAMDMYEPIWCLDISGLAVQSLNCNGPVQWAYCVFLEFLFIVTVFIFRTRLYSKSRQFFLPSINLVIWVMFIPSSHLIHNEFAFNIWDSCCVKTYSLSTSIEVYS